MPSGTDIPTASISPEQAVLKRGRLQLEVTLRPFAITLRRAGRRLLRNASAWAAEGTANDQFVQFTEGVVGGEDLDPQEPARRARVIDASGNAIVSDGTLQVFETDTLRLALQFQGGRQGELTLTLQADERLDAVLRVEGRPLRIALDWDRRSVEDFVGLGARHGTEFNQRGRDVQLGADRRYTGPDCPPEMLAEGGIPQGDCAPTPWMLSSRGYGVLAHTFANGTRFDMSTDRTAVSVRAHGGPLKLTFFCETTPAARLRALCRQTGFPMLLPEWAYGFWKSRDVHEDREAVLDDYHGFRRYGIPLDAIVIDSPWATQYNSWEFNPYQLPGAEEMVRMMRADGVRTVLWCTPWVNINSTDGQIPPQPESERLHREPAPNYEAGVIGGHYVHDEHHETWVGLWWMGTGSLVDFTSPHAEEWWRKQVKRVLRAGVEGIKMDDGDGFYVKDELHFADGRPGAEVAWENGSLHRLSLQRALDEVHPGQGVVFGRSGWIGQHATGLTWGADQASDFWSLRALVVATLSAAASGYSNWSHDVGGYLGHRLMERCPPELFVRWLQFGCFTPLMQAHSRFAHEPWNYGERMVNSYRSFVLLHEQLVPYTRAAAATAARTGLPIIRPLCLIDPTDPRGWEITDAYAYGPSLWVAPVMDEGARERDVELPRGDWIETWSEERVTGGGEVTAPAPLNRIPVWARAGAIIVNYPAEHVARGLGDTPEQDRPLEASLWGIPACGRALVKLANGTEIRWHDGEWSVTSEAEPPDITFRVIEA